MRNDVGHQHSSHSFARLAACAALAAALAAGAARGTEVTLELESATVGCVPCSGWYCGYYYYYYENDTCGNGEAPTQATLLPGRPAGTGAIHLDSAGSLIGGSLSLDAYTRNGEPIAAWTRPVTRRDPKLRQGLLTLDGGWGDAELTIDSFTSQSSFSGVIVNRVRRFIPETGEEVIVETYRFSSAAGASASLCPGARLYFDEDSDGQEDAGDAAPRGATDLTFGMAVDGSGRTVGDFCELGSGTRLGCVCRDFLNDEPRRRLPRDCRHHKLTQRCAPARFVVGALAPPFEGPTCEGLPVFSDADGDGEGDRSDRCPATPAGAAVDENGCSASQFCAAQPRAVCRRADFGNDEHGVKKPLDCLRTGEQCSATATDSGAGSWDY